ncbi:hypothetical protein M758_4G118900 [Ceratodon purpureus]|nr:hypothetical protein M758_4G118900 [Ceratodon purpureus]
MIEIKVPGTHVFFELDKGIFHLLQRLPVLYEQHPRLKTLCFCFDCLPHRLGLSELVSLVILACSLHVDGMFSGCLFHVVLTPPLLSAHLMELVVRCGRFNIYQHSLQIFRPLLHQILRPYNVPHNGLFALLLK